MEDRKTQTTVPIKVDMEIDVEIMSKGERGDGVTKVDNFIIFVPNAKVGDKIRIQVEKVFKNFGIGRRLIMSEEDIPDTDIEEEPIPDEENEKEEEENGEE